MFFFSYPSFPPRHCIWWICCCSENTEMPVLFLIENSNCWGDWRTFSSPMCSSRACTWCSIPAVVFHRIVLIIALTKTNYCLQIWWQEFGEVANSIKKDLSWNKCLQLRSYEHRLGGLYDECSHPRSRYVCDEIIIRMIIYRALENPDLFLMMPCFNHLM